MILSCNSCEKKFVVPDKAITSSGRLVQCGSCGNKWKQFPLKDLKEKNPQITKVKIKPTSEINIPKIKKKKSKKKREINLYSPEYLAKKHGITLNETIKETKLKNKVTFGFYNSLIFFIVIVIFLSRGLYFFQDFIIEKLPFTEFYLEYFFESIRNLFEIWKNLISSY